MSEEKSKGRIILGQKKVMIRTQGSEPDMFFSWRLDTDPISYRRSDPDPDFFSKVGFGSATLIQPNL